MLYFSELSVNMAHQKAIICDDGLAFTSDLMKNVLSCHEYKTLLYFTNESWVK